jgi:hypothetical protein
MFIAAVVFSRRYKTVVNNSHIYTSVTIAEIQNDMSRVDLACNMIEITIICIPIGPTT